MGKLNSYRLRHQKMTKAVMRKSMPIADQTTSQCLVLTCDYRDCHSGKGVLFAISSLVESELKHSDRRTLKTMIFTFCFFRHRIGVFWSGAKAQRESAEQRFEGANGVRHNLFC
jgi:hypothetical protein